MYAMNKGHRSTHKGELSLAAYSDDLVHHNGTKGNARNDGP